MIEGGVVLCFYDLRGMVMRVIFLNVLHDDAMSKILYHCNIILIQINMQKKKKKERRRKKLRLLVGR